MSPSGFGVQNEAEAGQRRETRVKDDLEERLALNFGCDIDMSNVLSVTIIRSFLGSTAWV